MARAITLLLHCGQSGEAAEQRFKAKGVSDVALQRASPFP